MRRCCQLIQIRKTAWSWPKGREFSEYVPGPPSPSDLKAPLPDKFSVGKNNRLKAVLFEYDLLAGSPSNRGRWGANGDSRVPTSFENNTTTKRKNAGGFQPLSVSGENLIDEITGLLGKARSAAGLNDNSLQDKGRNLMADLKNKMGESGPSETPHPKQSKSPQPSRHAQSSDPAAKYREKLRERTVGLSREESASSQPGGDGLLFAAKKTLASSEGVSQSAWMLRKGAGNLLLYLAARSVNLGVIASPRTSPAEFESFVDQLRQQSVKVRAAISPELLEAEGVEASVAKAFSELGLHGVGSEVLVVGSSDPILRAATAVEMFTARYHPPNTRREGVIQTFVVREIDEVRNVVEQLNGISYR